MNAYPPSKYIHAVIEAALLQAEVRQRNET